MNLAAAAALAGILLTGCSTEADETTAATTAAEAETTTAAVGESAETTEGGTLSGKKISVMTPYLTSVTTNQMAGYIKEDLEAEGAEVFVIDTANDFAELASRIEDVVSSGTDGIVLVSADPNQVANQLQDAFDADIPVFGCDSGFIDGMQINATSDKRFHRGGKHPRKGHQGPHESDHHPRTPALSSDADTDGRQVPTRYFPRHGYRR